MDHESFTMNITPWYRRGLRFECIGCGKCCTGEPGYVWVNKAEIEALATLLQISVEKFLKRYVRQVGIRKSLIELPNGDCIFFDNDRRMCQVYKARPRQCRSWPFWPANLSSPKAWQQTADFCLGCNRGQIISLDEIKAQTQAKRL